MTALGLLLALLAWPFLDTLASLMGAQGPVRASAVTYLRIRFVAAPAVLVTIVAFGALRGLQDMRTPFWIAVTVNVVNVVLDAALIFGVGPVPALGVAGAAWATTAAQIVGAAWAVAAVWRALGPFTRVRARAMLELFVVGRDLVLRTGLLLAFILLATRSATQAGAEPAAANQAVRQVWTLTALLLDAFAATTQTLVGFFLGAGQRALARRAALVGCQWGVAAGLVLTAAMLAATQPIAWLLVPPEARAVFPAAWTVAALAQPLNALSFITDGAHWGTGDFRYLRNGMLAATLAGALLLASVDVGAPGALVAIWTVTVAWTVVRASFGVLRIWPGIGDAPLGGRG